jgi:cbb3-type cytochrome oxidase subunit 1
MEWFVRAFLRSALVWLGLGVTLGVAMAIEPAWIVYRPAHLHLNLLGFVTMMIYGVAYHVIPRFAAHQLHWPGLARTHWWVSNAGLVLLAAGFLCRPHAAAHAVPVLVTGGVLSALGAYAFIYNIWQTLGGTVGSGKPAAAQASPRPAARGRALPTA